MSLRNLRLDHILNGSSIEETEIAVAYEMRSRELRKELVRDLSSHYAKLMGDNPSDELEQQIAPAAALLKKVPSINPEHNVFGKTMAKTLVLSAGLCVFNNLANIGISSSIVSAVVGSYVALQYMQPKELSKTDEEYAKILRQTIYSKELERLSQTPEFAGRTKELKALSQDFMLTRMHVSPAFIKEVEDELGVFKTKTNITKNRVLQNMQDMKEKFSDVAQVVENKLKPK